MNREARARRHRHKELRSLAEEHLEFLEFSMAWMERLLEFFSCLNSGIDSAVGGGGNGFGFGSSLYKALGFVDDAAFSDGVWLGQGNRGNGADEADGDCGPHRQSLPNFRLVI